MASARYVLPRANSHRKHRLYPRPRLLRTFLVKLHDNHQEISNLASGWQIRSNIVLGGYNNSYTKNQDNMMTSSIGNIFPHYWPFVRGIHRSSLNSPHKGQWRGALMFSLICAWSNGWVNTREAGDLRRYRAHYDVVVMIYHVPRPEKIISVW